MKGRNICIVHSVYALLLYLLNAKDEEIDETYYILDAAAVKEEYSTRLKYCWYYRELKDNLPRNPFLRWYLQRGHLIKQLPKLHKEDNLYMQDHRWSLLYAWDHKYTFIEDSACICNKVVEKHQTSWSNMTIKMMNDPHTFRRWVREIFTGPMYLFAYATHRNAYRLLLSQNDPSEYLKDRERIILPTMDKYLWNSFSEFKKKRIMEIYNISEQDIKDLRDAANMVFTQPLWPDMLTKKEHESIYSKVISNYDPSTLIIKIHPRDTFDYAKAYPGIKVFRKPAPIELLKMCGLNVKKAITVFSMAVTSIGCEVDWYGTRISEELYAKVGELDVPEGVNDKSSR